MKMTNEYSNALGSLYAQAPKAVLAAIAVSSLTCGGDYLAEARERVYAEWSILHFNGIVPQAPPKSGAV